MAVAASGSDPPVDAGAGTAGKIPVKTSPRYVVTGTGAGAGAGEGEFGIGPSLAPRYEAEGDDRGEGATFNGIITQTTAP